MMGSGGLIAQRVVLDVVAQLLHLIQVFHRALALGYLAEYLVQTLCSYAAGSALCSKKCPVGAISGEIRNPFKIDSEKCIKCGVCMSNCKFGAIVKG